jgi:hypothetical protein
MPLSWSCCKVQQVQIMEIQKRTSRKQNVLFHEWILFDHCRQVRRATRDSENRSESTSGKPEGVLSCKREAIPWPRKVMEKSIIFLWASSTIKQSESESKQGNSQVWSPLLQPRSIVGQRSISPRHVCLNILFSHMPSHGALFSL